MKRLMMTTICAMLAAGNLGFRPAPDPREPTPATGICFEGKIESIFTNPNVLWVSAKLVYVPKAAKIMGATGETETVENLKPGLDVRVCGWSNPDKSIVATHVEVLAAK